MESTPAVIVSSAGLRALAGWEAAFADPAFSAGEWAGGVRVADGLTQMPWFRQSEAITRFAGEMAATGMVRPVDWMAWAGTTRGRALILDPAAVADATPEELVHLVTSIIRGERFADGTIEAAVERGTLLAAARRAAALLADPSRIDV